MVVKPLTFERSSSQVDVRGPSWYTGSVMDYKDIITIEKGKRGGQPVIRGMRISVYDILQYLASGMSFEDILKDFPELTDKDIRAALQFAADREKSSLHA